MAKHNQKKKRGKLARVLIIIGIAFIIAAAILAAYNLAVDLRAGSKSSSVLSEMQSQIVTDDDNAKDWQVNPNIEMPTIKIDGREYIGVLKLPTLGLTLPVASEWSYEALYTSPCRYSGSAYLNNMVIAAHSYRKHFGTLQNISIGDAVTFIDAKGNEFNYEVADIETLQPTDVKDMTQSDYDLTLFTCTYGGQSRVTVRCNIVEN